MQIDTKSLAVMSEEGLGAGLIVIYHDRPQPVHRSLSSENRGKCLKLKSGLEVAPGIFRPSNIVLIEGKSFAPSTGERCVTTCFVRETETGSLPIVVGGLGLRYDVFCERTDEEETYRYVDTIGGLPFLTNLLAVYGEDSGGGLGIPPGGGKRRPESIDTQVVDPELFCQ